jgi:hypothetical protein
VATADSTSKPAADTGATRLAAANRAAADRAADDQPAGTERPKPAAEPAAPPKALAARSQRAADVAAAGNAAADNAAAAGEAEQPPAAAAPPPMPPSLETQSRISTRIGLDDARRELGSPLHGIDGLRPRLVGLIPGRLVPGADPSRNAVWRSIWIRTGRRSFSISSGSRRAGGRGRLAASCGVTFSSS